jgi:isoleucyl-tRNA synthetase
MCIRDRSEGDEDKVTAYLVLYECLVKLIQVMAPIMPFLTEELYQNLVVQVNKEAAQSIHLCDFPVSDAGIIDEKLENEIALTRTVVSLGRSARNQANLKIRQPLDKILVTMPKDDITISDADTQVILEELNIKRLEMIGQEVLDGLSEYRVVPRFDQLGPKYGKEAGRIAELIKSLSQDEIQKLAKSGSLEKKMGKDVLQIVMDDVGVKRVGKSGWSVACEDELGVGISTVLTDELKNEGLVRELIHKVQLMRKEAGFEITDRIKICYEAGADLKRAIQMNLDYLMAETLATEVSEGVISAEIEKSLKINGVRAKIVLQRVNPA